MQSSNLNEIGIWNLGIKCFVTCGELLQIAAKHWVHKACCLYRAEWVARRQTALGKIHEECFCLMPWNTVEDDYKVWMEVVATSGQTFLLFCPLEELAGFSFVLLCSSAFWLTWGRVSFLPFHSLASIQFLCMSCLDAAAALQQQHFGLSAVLPDHHRSPQRVILTNPLSPASALHWSFPRGKPAKALWLPFTGTPGTLACNPAAIDTGTAKALPSLGLLWGWDNPALALEGPVFSEQKSGIRFVQKLLISE